MTIGFFKDVHWFACLCVSDTKPFTNRGSVCWCRLISWWVLFSIKRKNCNTFAHLVRKDISGIFVVLVWFFVSRFCLFGFIMAYILLCVSFPCFDNMLFISTCRHVELWYTYERQYLFNLELAAALFFCLWVSAWDKPLRHWQGRCPNVSCLNECPSQAKEMMLWKWLCHVWQRNTGHMLFFGFIGKADLYFMLFSTPQRLLLYSCFMPEGEAQIQFENSYLEIKCVASRYADKSSLIKTPPDTWEGQRQSGLSMWAQCRRDSQYSLLQTLINYEGGLWRSQDRHKMSWTPEKL